MSQEGTRQAIAHDGTGAVRNPDRRRVLKGITGAVAFVLGLSQEGCDEVGIYKQEGGIQNGTGRVVYKSSGVNSYEVPENSWKDEWYMLRVLVDGESEPQDCYVSQETYEKFNAGDQIPVQYVLVRVMFIKNPVRIIEKLDGGWTRKSAQGKIVKY